MNNVANGGINIFVNSQTKKYLTLIMFIMCSVGINVVMYVVYVVSYDKSCQIHIFSYIPVQEVYGSEVTSVHLHESCKPF